MTILAAGSEFLDRLVAGLPVRLVLMLSAVALVSSLAAAVLIMLAKRGRQKEAREIVVRLEEMRSGRARVRLDLDPRSPFAPIAESVNRLGQDLSVQWSRAETANEGFHALQEAARDYAVIATDADGDLRAFSPGAGQMFGWDEDAVVGRNASLFFDEASWKDLLPKLARKSLRERGVETRALMTRKDGTRFQARLNVRLLHAHGDEHPGFLLVVHDVTEQVRVEDELRVAESRARRLLEDLPGGVALVEHGRIVYANASLRSLLELGETEVEGFALRDRIATSHVLVVQDALTRLETGPANTISEATVTILDASGRPAHEVRFVAAAHRHEGRPAVLVTLRDETAERRLVRTLAAEEGRLDAVLDAWDDAVLLVEDEASGARVRLANRSFLSLFGLTRGAIWGVAEGDLLRALRERGPEGTAAAACLAAAGGGPARDRVVAPERAIAFWAAPLSNAAGILRGRLLVARDITADQGVEAARDAEIDQWRRRHDATEAAHAKLRALHHDLETRRQEAENLNQELRTLDGMKSDLLANVSHELQTPLVSIRGYTEMILKGRLGAINDEQRKGLSLSLKNIDRLIAMIDNLLAFARMDRESGTMRISTFPLAGVVDEALALLRERLEAKNLDVSRQIGDSSVAVRADRDKILQVFLNLLGNAVKFSREGGAIDVSARPGKPGFLLVQVRDAGVGIAKEDLEKVFDRFYQSGSASAQGKEGTGIGLAIVRNILRLHGCVIHATSEPGEGTVLSFTLPLAKEGAGTHESATPVEPPPDTPRDDGERPRLRIIRRG